MKSLFILILFISTNVMAYNPEPAFCNRDYLKNTEIDFPNEGLHRAHVYQLGSLTLAGLAVGHSDTDSVVRLANTFSEANQSQNYCTWYFNKGNADAEMAFNHHYVSSPMFKSPKIAEQYRERLEYMFLGKGENTIGSCAVNQNYIAMGCNGQKHRGPSVFAMFLSFAGCSPESATKIANKTWNKNFVPKKTRTAIAKVGWDFGNENPELRYMLQSLMLD